MQIEKKLVANLFISIMSYIFCFPYFHMDINYALTIFILIISHVLMCTSLSIVCGAPFKIFLVHCGRTVMETVYARTLIFDG